MGIESRCEDSCLHGSARDLNRLLLDPGETSPGQEVVLDGRRARHLLEVLRVAPGAALRAGIVDGPLGTATVIATAADTVTVRFAATTAAPPPWAVTLVVAVPRPKVLSRLIQIAAAFGVEAIHLTRSWRVDKAYLESPRLAPDALSLDARLGAEQGATTTTRLPVITQHARFMAMLDAVAVPADGRAIALHPTTAALPAVPIERAIPPGTIAPVIAAIGPEGGWIEREVATFAARGYAVVELARPILRVEAAVAALLGQLALLQRL